MKFPGVVRLTLPCVALVASGVAAAATAAAAGSGFLEAAQREYTPQGCTQNGNTAVCTFAVVNRGNPLTLRAWPGDLRTLQLVDGSHVPHGANRGYFVDSSGNHQTQLVLQAGDQGSIAVEFPNANVSGTTPEFHLHSQIVGGAASSAQNTTGTSTPQAASGSAGSSAAPTAPAAAATPAAAAAPGKTASANPATPAGAGGSAATAHAPAAAAPMATQTASTQPAACATNAKSAACRAADQEERVCAKNPSSAACKQATARAQKLEAAGK